MKNIVTFIFTISFLIIGIQRSVAQMYPEQKNGYFGLSYDFYISEPFSSETPMSKNGAIRLYSDEWGGGDDTPDPTVPSTGGDMPIGNGIPTMTGFAFVFLLVKRIRKQAQLNVNE